MTLNFYAIIGYLYIFQGLRMNRTLLTLSLASNYVGDRGAIKLAEVITMVQAFRLMVGPGHCPMISKYGPSLSKAVGPLDKSFVVVNTSHFNKNSHLTASLRTPQNRKYM